MARESESVTAPPKRRRTQTATPAKTCKTLHTSETCTRERWVFSHRRDLLACRTNRANEGWCTARHHDAISGPCSHLCNRMEHRQATRSHLEALGTMVQARVSLPAVIHHHPQVFLGFLASPPPSAASVRPCVPRSHGWRVASRFPPGFAKQGGRRVELKGPP